MRVLLFGRLADLAGWRERRFEPPPTTLAALRAQIAAADAELGAAITGPGVRAAIDKVIVNGEAVLGPDTEVAFLPPMSGG